MEKPASVSHTNTSSKNNRKNAGSGGVNQDDVLANKLWVKAIERENRARQKWDDNWSFLVDYYRETPKLEQKENSNLKCDQDIFSEGSNKTIFKTEASKYGSGLNTNLGQVISSLQANLTPNKTGSFIGCIALLGIFQYQILLNALCSAHPVRHLAEDRVVVLELEE
ncbi:hypothetical protein HELRODRAFT_163247 [Helobdella robusta]|uniref:Uncharacterized protein n=1 Tax=Helobdella robusta TaxID=6412 RepID=T1ETU1_HELRO|nr:hypothetical protein HELRODRAFT_163247 [Helobdella robusta]ESN96206.1 hypothetical protein HELRODRAFT_163247 [Helobdella robusta]